MVTLKPRCPRCGPVQLPVSALWLVADREGETTEYHFDCPACGRLVMRPADSRMLTLLGAVGVETVERVPARPPFTRDDLLAFHELLERDDWQSLLHHPRV